MVLQKKKVTKIVNPVMVTNSTAYRICDTNPTSQDIGPQGISEEKNIALIKWENNSKLLFISGPSI